MKHTNSIDRPLVLHSVCTISVKQKASFSKYINFIVGIMLFIPFFQPSKAEKRALIIAISKYPEKSGWNSLSADNDAIIIKEGLLKQEFPKENIAVLLDEQATKVGITNAFNKLTTQTQPGDVVFFLFSGHGQQVTDINKDEIDGWDEALVPYDAPKRNTTGERSASRHLIDDDLNVCILKLREKAGKSGDIFVCIDACHSGTINRGNHEPEVTRYIIPGYKHKTMSVIKRNIFADSVQNNNDKNLAPFLVISLSAAELTNREYCDKHMKKSYGILSYSISNLFSRDISNMSYTAFFESLRVIIWDLGIKQQPQMEGNAERKMFSGNAIVIPNHFSVESYTPEDNIVIIRGGLLAGIKQGTKINFYPPDTYNVSITNPIQTATVIDAGLTESMLKLSPSQKTIDLKSWAVISKYTFPKGKEKEERARLVRGAWSTKKDIELEIIPVDKDGKAIDLETKKRNGNFEFFRNDWFNIKIINTGKEPLYFQLINVSAADEITLVKIGTAGTKYDYYIKSEESKTAELKVDANTPYGLETLVLVAYKNPLELSTIETQKPNSIRSGQNEFEDFLNSIYGNERSYQYIFQNVSVDKVSFYVKSKSEIRTDSKN